MCINPSYIVMGHYFAGDADILQVHAQQLQPRVR